MADKLCFDRGGSRHLRTGSSPHRRSRSTKLAFLLPLLLFCLIIFDRPKRRPGGRKEEVDPRRERSLKIRLKEGDRKGHPNPLPSSLVSVASLGSGISERGGNRRVGAVGQISERSNSSLHLYKGCGPALEGRFSPNKLGLSSFPSDHRASGEGHSLFHSSVARAEVCLGAAQSSSFSVPLFPHILGAKGYHISKTHYGPLPSQSLAMQETFQDGRPEEGQQVCPPGHVGGEVGPKGCLLAPSSGRSDPSLLRLCLGRSSSNQVFPFVFSLPNGPSLGS